MRPEALVPRAQLYHTGKGHLRWNEQSYGGARRGHGHRLDIYGHPNRRSRTSNVG